MTRSPTLAVTVAIALASVAGAQVPAVTLPQIPQRFTVSGDGRPVDSLTAQFDVGGLRVILRRNPANDVVAANLYLLGGTQQLTPATQGIEAFLLAASERGTRHYPDGEAERRTARLGSTIEIDPEEDWTAFGLRAIRTTFDSTWAIFADRVMYPSLDSTDVEAIRQQMLTSVEQQRADPDASLSWLADSVLFARQAYGLAAQGTANSLSHITAAQLRAYHASQFVTSRMLLVVVGNVTRDDVERLVAGTLARLPRGGYVWKMPQIAAGRSHTPQVQRETLPTNYLLGYYVGPPATSRDYDALRIASAVLAGRFFTEIRSRRNLTYAVDAPFLSRAVAVGGVYVTTVQPDSVLEIMRHELDELQSDVIEPAGLKRLLQQFITEYYLKNETDADQANLLAQAYLYRGDYRLASRFVDELRMVTPDDVRRVARQYMRDFQFVYIGDPSRLSTDVTSRF